MFVVPRTANRVSRLVTPLKPYEAMALERAVVVSDLPALREIVTPGETGLTFRAEDAEDLAEVLGRLLDDPALRARLGRQAREWILAERTWAANGRDTASCSNAWASPEPARPAAPVVPRCQAAPAGAQAQHLAVAGRPAAGAVDRVDDEAGAP